MESANNCSFANFCSNCLQILLKVSPDSELISNHFPTKKSCILFTSFPWTFCLFFHFQMMALLVHMKSLVSFQYLNMIMVTYRSTNVLKYCHHPRRYEKLRLMKSRNRTFFLSVQIFLKSLRGNLYVDMVGEFLFRKRIPLFSQCILFRNFRLSSGEVWI